MKHLRFEVTVNGAPLKYGQVPLEDTASWVIPFTAYEVEQMSQAGTVLSLYIIDVPAEGQMCQWKWDCANQATTTAIKELGTPGGASIEVHACDSCKAEADASTS